MVQDALNIFNYRLVINLHRAFTSVSESNMIDGAVFREVDLFASEHSIPKLLKISLFSEIDKKLESLFSQEVLGEVKEDLAIWAHEGLGELGEARRIFLESITEDE